MRELVAVEKWKEQGSGGGAYSETLTSHLHPPRASHLHSLLSLFPWTAYQKLAVGAIEKNNIVAVILVNSYLRIRIKNSLNLNEKLIQLKTANRTKFD